MRQNHLLDGTLLKVRKGIQIGTNHGPAIGNISGVIRCGDGTSATSVGFGNPSSFHFAHQPLLGDSNMGTVHQQTISTFGNVMRHGGKSCLSRPGKPSQSTEVEIPTIGSFEVVFQLSGRFITAKGCS